MMNIIRTKIDLIMVKQQENVKYSNYAVAQ